MCTVTPCPNLRPGSLPLPRTHFKGGLLEVGLYKSLALIRQFLILVIR